MALVDRAAFSELHSHKSVSDSSCPDSSLTLRWIALSDTHRSAIQMQESGSNNSHEQLVFDGLGILEALDNLTASDNERTDHTLLDDLVNFRLERDGAEANRKHCNSDQSAQTQVRPPFRRWMRSLHRRVARVQTHGDMKDGLFGDRSVFKSPLEEPLPATSRHHARSSASSSMFISAVRSASVSVADASVLHPSRKVKQHSRSLYVAERSSRASYSGHRVSADSIGPERSLVLDRAAVERSIKRRQVLRELLDTEESYIGDIKFLINFYVTILAAAPPLSNGLRTSIHDNLTEIVQLHEGVLVALSQAILQQPEAKERKSKKREHSVPGILNRHRRWSNLEAGPNGCSPKECPEDLLGSFGDPLIIAKVSRIFNQNLSRFFIYQEYGAKYEMMLRDISSATPSDAHWDTYQKGLEVLASTVGNKRNMEAGCKKALTAADLLVKPIQRICKYPLLFSELLRYTPVIDCPTTHIEIEGVLSRLRTMAREIDLATNNDALKSSLRRSWLLQDRLVFPTQSDPNSRIMVRLLGFIQLCGVLHVSWQTKENVAGCHMICLLYRDFLCFAVADRLGGSYSAKACIRLSGARIEHSSNGRGLQCHTAPYSWKLVFECEFKLFEVIMTASSAAEEIEWRQRLVKSSGRDDCHESRDRLCFLQLNVKSLGSVFLKSGDTARQRSIQRAMTVVPKTPACHLVLHNTTASRDESMITQEFPVCRSRSLMTAREHVPVLSPLRSERARLESLMADVWSRDVLPFPTVTSLSRSEQLVRSSASTLMRKLSVASLASSFNRRPSASTTSPTHDENELIASSRQWRHEEIHRSRQLSKHGQSRNGTSQSCFTSTVEISRHVQAAEECEHDTACEAWKMPQATQPDDTVGDILGYGQHPAPSAVEATIRSLDSNSNSPIQDPSSVSDHKENMGSIERHASKTPRRWNRAKLMRSEGKGRHGLRNLFR